MTKPNALQMMQTPYGTPPALPATTQNVAAIAAPPETEEVDLQRIWRVVRQRLRAIILMALAVTGLVGLVVFPMHSVYRSTGTLIVEPRESKILSIEKLYETDTTKAEYLLTQFEVLRSRDLVRKVIAKLHLDTHPAFMPKHAESSEAPGSKAVAWFAYYKKQIKQAVTDLLTPPEEAASGKEGLDSTALTQEEQLVDNFLANLSVKPRTKTQLVDISFDNEDPNIARLIVDTLGQTFIENSYETQVSNTQQAAQWLSERLQSLKESLTSSEKNLQDFLEKRGLIDLDGVFTLTHKEIDRDADRLAEARQNRNEAEHIYEKARTIGPDGAGSESIPEVANDPVVLNLKQREAEINSRVSQLKDRFGPDHPLMAAALSEQRSVRNSLKIHINHLISGMKSRYDLAVANEQSAVGNVDTHKRKIQVIGRDQTQLRDLQRQEESSRHLYEMFLNRYKEVTESALLHDNNVRFVDRASNPTGPVAPKKKTIMLISFIASLLGGCLLALMQEKLDSTIKSSEDVEQKLRAPLLGTVPLQQSAKGMKDNKHAKGVNLTLLQESEPIFTESIRALRTGLVLSALDDPRRVWLISSSLANEGKSTLSLALAFAFAKLDSGRVLLIDTDLRRPVLSDSFNLPRGCPGLGHVLARTAPVESCIYTIGQTNLDVMPAGLVPPNPLDLLSSRRFSELLESLETRYSAILLDSPPMHFFTDGLLLAQHARSVIHVVKAGQTPSGIVREDLAQLQKFGVPLAGIVLNQVTKWTAKPFPNAYGFSPSLLEPGVDSATAKA